MSSAVMVVDATAADLAAGLAVDRGNDGRGSVCIVADGFGNCGSVGRDAITWGCGFGNAGRGPRGSAGIAGGVALTGFAGGECKIVDG